jgi:membrane associated rhomboid family serine protease
MSNFGQTTRMPLPRPGKVLKAVMLVLFAIWLMFAIALNWAGASEEAFLLFCGNTDRVLHGEVWRLITAPLLNAPNTPFSILFMLLGMYFLTPSLEEQWGGRRLLRFLFLSALIAYTFQMLVDLALPASVTSKLVPPYWFSTLPVLDAIAVAFAFAFAGRTVHLMFLFPVSSKGLIGFVFVMNVLYVIAAQMGPSGAVAPFGGMLAGWLLGGGTPSPMRRAWLKLRLAQLDSEARRAKGDRKKRVAASSLRVVGGGKRGRDGTDDDDGPSGTLLN